ncbi:ATP-grasp domain-containing protein [Streptomyces sp. NPDC048290]|uniref:ATP-grasp domain-containing protein n=1 Tax=Streptomyces sp. NPDC048290 TaxID=3155811 RepID=UPI00341FA4AE
MTRHLAFVEANTTGTGMIALRTARDLGFVPVFLTSDRTRYLGLEETGAEVVDCDTNAPATLTATLGALPGSLAGVTTTSEFYVLAVAEAAAELGLPGNPPEVVRRCRDKGQVRAALRAAGMPQPRFAVVRAEEDLDEALTRVGLPCVAKPVDDSGSQLVQWCGTRNEVREHAAQIMAVRTNVRGQRAAGAVLLEEFLDAPEFSVEMFSVDGVHRCVGITRKTVTGSPYFVETRHIYPAPLEEAAESVLHKAAVDALDVLGIRLGPTHVEIRLTSQGPALIELNPRLAGGMIPELVRLAHGADLLRQQLHAALGHDVDLRPTRDGIAGVAFLLPPREGVLRRITGAQEAARLEHVARVTVTGQPGREVRLARNAYDRLGSVITHGRDTAEVDAALDKALEVLEVELEDLVPPSGPARRNPEDGTRRQ